MKNINDVLARVAQCFAGFALVSLIALALVPIAHSDENWKDAFEEVCSKVDISSNLSVKELQALIDRSDKLAPEIQKSDDPGKKVYLRRLKNCRSMFEFAIDSKNIKEK